ncbi:DNA cytosine methyltransferase [Virgibacillus dokdonensis]|uniref:Cytosine-specific methyltransferase n=1 Tax=Virgibacillus dokdonensis TaxID=302167 RepID=A0ABU7VL56_9BACI
MKKQYTFIDLFAGIGGMRLGLEKAGFKCVYSSEWDPHAKEMYELNFGEDPEGDITSVNEKSIPDHNVLLAGFPCQPFSISGRKEGFADTRGTLFFDVLRIAQEKQPDVLLLENVKHLVHHDRGRTLQVILRSLRELGYKVDWRLMNAKDFGVPQNRERIIIIASKDREFNFDLIETSDPVMLEDFLDKEGDFEYLSPDEYTLLDDEHIKVQKSGLIFVGYRNKKIRVAGVRPGTEHLSRVHKQPNRIYSTKGTHPTIPSQETAGRFFIYHEGQVRKLTLRECYRIMGFPDNYKLAGPIGSCYLRIGNSVCVPMIEAIAKQIDKQILSQRGKEKMVTHYDVLERVYSQAINTELDSIDITEEEKELLQTIVNRAEKSKGVYTVVVTSLTQKILNPNQDIRLHQANMIDGYSGRSVDTKYVTPFLKSVGFPAMKESGWLTRSLEQPYPYDKDYQGKVTPAILKKTFLEVLHRIETYNADPEQYLLTMFVMLIEEQRTRDIAIINPIEKESNIPIRTIISYLISHFNYRYLHTSGASRLPVLAFYSIYQCMMEELDRFNGKELLPLGNHLSADMRSGAVGDIEIKDAETGDIYEGLEVKHGIKINKYMVSDAYSKFKTTKIQRYYILSSVGIDPEEQDDINELIYNIEEEHGCQVIVNGLIPSLQYYLRLIKDTDKFLQYYVENLENDQTIKKEHKLYWNEMFTE